MQIKITLASTAHLSERPKEETATRADAARAGEGRHQHTLLPPWPLPLGKSVAMAEVTKLQLPCSPDIELLGIHHEAMKTYYGLSVRVPPSSYVQVLLCTGMGVSLEGNGVKVG